MKTKRFKLSAKANGIKNTKEREWRQALLQQLRDFYLYIHILIGCMLSLYSYIVFIFSFYIICLNRTHFNIYRPTTFLHTSSSSSSLAIYVRTIFFIPFYLIVSLNVQFFLVYLLVVNFFRYNTVLKVKYFIKYSHTAIWIFFHQSNNISIGSKMETYWKG